LKHIDDLIQVIRELHGAEATHRESVPVKETWQGQTIWEGIVEVFTLKGHPETDTAYAWSHDTDDGPRRHVTVLHVHPAISPLHAVRAALLQEYRDANPA
jgi:hypothetical protein